ncbi:ferric reductase-like transmembrane domain-containing protein [Candidatus Dojkabacteria bacterium]|nr:ferric reductase-like transmembrane domain-containing protein [Candidatus Dojkabacteria bacterium]
MITVALWLLARLELGFQTALLAASQLSALLAATFLSLNYIIATRSRIVEKVFDGLDVAYQAHHNIGGLAFLFMLTHPMLLIIQSFPSLELFKLYTLPSEFLPYTTGVLGLYLYIGLLLLTYYSKLPYHIWIMTHRYMGIPLFVIFLHVILMSNDIARFLPLKIWILSLLILAMLSYLYRRFLYKYLAPKRTYSVLRTKIVGDIVEVYLKPKRKKILPFPGQFVFVIFKGKNVTSEEHAFSISGISKEGIIRLSIKKSGDFTDTVGNLEVGDMAVLIGPHGKFGENLLEDRKDLIWVAGGIGIAPFITMLEHEIKTGRRNVTLFYTLKDANNGDYIKEIEHMIRSRENITIVTNFSAKQGRLNVEGILSHKAVKEYDLKKTKVFICGPTPMMDEMTPAFVKGGIAPWNIIKEDFILR